LQVSEGVGSINIPPAFGGAGIAAEDIDNDGDADLPLLSGTGNRLYPKDELADEVKLHLQPCSDRMCLPPEVITIH